MSMVESIHGGVVQRGSIKCRIPRRLPSTRPKTIANKIKPPEITVWSKAGNRTKDDGKPNVQPPRSIRDRYPLIVKNEKPLTTTLRNKNPRSIITVPVTNSVSHQPSGHYNSWKSNNFPTFELPDQETIRQCEEKEVENSGISNSPDSGDSNTINNCMAPTKSIEQKAENSKFQSPAWQKLVSQFEEMKNDLAERQNAIITLYTNIHNTYNNMSSKGQNVSLPSSDDLQIMNISALPPAEHIEELVKNKKDAALVQQSAAIDAQNLYNLSSRLISTCELTLFKREEIINWFISLKSERKGVPMNLLEKKINEFTAENDMLTCSLEQAKKDFQNDMMRVVGFLQKTVKDAVALQLRTEEQTYKLSELNWQNQDLRKQIHNNEILRPNKENLEKQLKEEKCKYSLMKGRFSKLDGQIKIEAERSAELESALGAARHQTRTLERTVEHLTNQNLKIQSDFDRELSKLTDSIRENTTHLEDIAQAREKLELEKEGLEKRLEQLSQSYTESLASMKHDLNVSLAKLLDAEKKYQETVEDKTEILAKLDTVSAVSQVYKTNNKELLNKIQEYEEQLNKVSAMKKEYDATKHDFESTLSDLSNYRIQLDKQNDTIKTLQEEVETLIRVKDKQKTSLTTRDEYIAELEKKQMTQEQQLQESAKKMNSYEKQMTSLKNRLAKLQEDFGELESMNRLQEEVKQQREKLLEEANRKEELAQSLESKEKELQEFSERYATQTKLLEQRNGTIKTLSEKEMEQTNIIKLLRNNLEMRTQADTDFSRQISDKKTEINNLIANLDARKQQISQLEKIILTLEEQNQKCSLQWKKDQDKIKLLEKQVTDYEGNYVERNRNDDHPASNLDSIIKILEEELDASVEPQYDRPGDYLKQNNKYMSVNKHFDYQQGNNSKCKMVYQTDHESMSAKIVLGKIVEQFGQLESENLNRKKGITNIDTQMWVADPDSGGKNASRMYPPPPLGQVFVTNANVNGNTFLPKNIAVLNDNEYRNSKRFKMFKLAGHRL